MLTLGAKKIKGARASPNEPFLNYDVYDKNIHIEGGESWHTQTINILTNSHSFRDHEQASSRILVQNAVEAWYADRPRQQTAGEKIRQKRSLPL